MAVPPELAPTPLLTENYSGTPLRLTKEAAAARARLYSNRTLPASRPRKNGVRLPPDTTKDVFDEAIAELKGLIGKDNVEISDKALVDGWYLEHPNTHDAFHIVEQEELVSSAVVAPGSTEEVQSVVRWANTYGIPLWPISLGRNVGYGGAAPRVPGSVVVDLGRRMNRVLKIDGDNASCVVEPGVTYFALYDEIQKLNLPLWIDCPDLGGGSVLGNAIDRGVGYTPYGDHFASRCGMEIVLPNGELLRTGMGAMPGKDGEDNPTWQSFQHAFGPSIDGIFSQSNFGIITKMGMQLMPETPHQSYCFTFLKDEDFEQIVDIIRPLAQQGILGNIPQLRHIIQELNVTGRRKDVFHSSPTPMTRAEIREAAKGLPFGDCSWVFYGTQYGPPQSIAAQMDVIKDAFGKIPGSKLWFPKDVPEDHYLHSRVAVCSGVPVLRELDWLNWLPNAGHLFFSPIAPTRGKDASTIHEIVCRAHAKYGFDLFPTLCIAGREIHYITNIIYDRAVAEQKSRAIKMMREMIAECAAEGYGEYRTHLLFADQVAKTYSWNNQALLRFNETIKDALDPNGIMAPGRNGIWPKKYRGKGWELEEEDVDMKTIGPRRQAKL